MTIQEIHNFILLLLNKHNTGYSTPEEIDSALDRAQMWYFNKLTGHVEEYQPGRPVPRVAYGMTSVVHDHLAPFKSSLLNETIPSSGELDLSSLDYMFFISSYKNSTGFKIPLLSEDELAQRISSHIIAPTSSEPVVTTKGNSVLLFYPNQAISGINLFYLRRPAKPVFGYTQSGRTITYNSGTSTQMEWNEPALNAIIMRAVQYLGVNLDDQLAISYSEGKIQQGT